MLTEKTSVKSIVKRERAVSLRGISIATLYRRLWCDEFSACNILSTKRFNYRASGLFGQSSKENDPNAIVLLQDTPLQGGHQYVSSSSVGTLATDMMGAAGSMTLLWGLPRPSVAQAFRHPPTQHNTLGNLPSNANNYDNDYYYKSTDKSIDNNSDLQHCQTYSMTPPSQKEEMLNRTYH